MHILLALGLSIALAFLLVKILILPLIKRFDRFQEYIFLIAIGWCLGIAELSDFSEASPVRLGHGAVMPTPGGALRGSQAGREAGVQVARCGAR